MNSEQTDLTFQIRKLTHEINTWHSLIFTPAVNTFGADLDSSYHDKKNQELIAALKPYDDVLISHFTRENFDKAAILVLTEWNKDNLSKTYLEQVVATQLYKQDD